MSPTDDDMKSRIRKFRIHVSPEMHQRTLRDVLGAYEDSQRTRPVRKSQPVQKGTNVMKVLKWLTPATAGCVVLIAILWNVMGGSGAQEAYAAAIDRVVRARTFSCKQILEVTRDGKKRVMEQAFMFKEPDRERREFLAGVDDKFIRDVTITDYGRRRRLHLRPSDKTASLMDYTADFVIDTDTGKLRLSLLDTSLRDRLLARRAGAVEDLGSVELDGRSVRMLRSRRRKSVIDVWVDPHTDLPVQIAINQPQYKQRWIYTSIQIDVELDDDLFSVDPPEGYRLFRGGMFKPVPDDKAKMYAKMMHLLHLCAVFAARNDDQFPRELSDLVGTSGLTDEKLATILAAPGRPDGPAVIRYRQPRPDAAASTEIVLYEVHDEWPDAGIAVGFADCHCEVIPNQELFEKLLR